MAKLTVSGFKVKSTRLMLELYLNVLEQYSPCCIHAAKMSLWDNKELTFNYTNAQISIMMHNMVTRLYSAYLAEWNQKCPIHLVYQQVGMMRLDDHIQLVRDAIALPSILCNDRSINP